MVTSSCAARTELVRCLLSLRRLRCGWEFGTGCWLLQCDELYPGAFVVLPLVGWTHPIHFASRQGDYVAVSTHPARVEIGHALVAHGAIFPRSKIADCDSNHSPNNQWCWVIMFLFGAHQCHGVGVLLNHYVVGLPPSAAVRYGSPARKVNRTVRPARGNPLEQQSAVGA
jgi:hypothetical protein